MIRRANVYDLGQPYWQGMPVHPADPPFQYYLYRYHEHTMKLFESIAPGFADSIGLVVTSMHAGTHFDTPIHMSRNLKVLGHDITPYQQDKGYSNLPDGLHSVDEVPPLVMRSVLLDVPSYKGLQTLPERYEITAKDLEETERSQSTKIGAGDCVLVRTGYSKFFMTDSDAYLHKFAGLGAEAAKWLAKRKVRLVGIDNLAAGGPPPLGGYNFLFRDKGIFLVKSLFLEEISKDPRPPFLVVLLPPKIKGGEASLVRPIAIA